MKLCLVRFFFGVTIFILGVLFYLIYHPLVFQYFIEHHLATLLPYSIYSSIFMRDTIIHSEYYIFELINGQAFLRGQKPILREHGPYAFQMTRSRNNLTWFHDDYLVSYYEKTVFHFDREKSVSDLEDVKLTVINLPFLAIMNKLLITLDNSNVLRLMSPVINVLAKQIMSIFGETLLERRTPYDILYGRPFEIFNKIKTILKPFAGLSNLISDGLQQLPAKIGQLYERNDTMVGPRVLYTGQRSLREFWLEFGEDYGPQDFLVQLIDQLMNIRRSLIQTTPMRTPMSFHSYKGKLSYDLYASPLCDRIGGSEGSMFNNFAVKHHRILPIFTIACKKFDLVFDKQIYFAPDIPIEQYTLDPYTFSMLKQENWCYCKYCRKECVSKTKRKIVETTAAFQLTNQTNLPPGYFHHKVLQRCDGFHDIQECSDAPIALSFPHFMYSHNLVSMMAGGIKPLASKHKTYFNIDPLTGLTFGAFAKLQLNMRLNQIRTLSGYENVGSNIVPFLWLNEGAVPTDEEQKQANLMLSFFYNFKYLGFTFAFVGIMLMLWDMIRLIKLIDFRKSEHRKIFHDENNLKVLKDSNQHFDLRYGRTPKSSKVDHFSMPSIG